MSTLLDFRCCTSDLNPPCHCEHREAIHGGSLGVHGLIWPWGPVLDCRSTPLTTGRVGLYPPRNDEEKIPSLRVKRSNPGDWLLALRLMWPWGPSLDCFVGLRPPRNDEEKTVIASVAKQSRGGLIGGLRVDLASGAESGLLRRAIALLAMTGTFQGVWNVQSGAGE